MIVTELNLSGAEEKNLIHMHLLISTDMQIYIARSHVQYCGTNKGNHYNWQFAKKVKSKVKNSHTSYQVCVQLSNTLQR